MSRPPLKLPPLVFIYGNSRVDNTKLAEALQARNQEHAITWIPSPLNRGVREMLLEPTSEVPLEEIESCGVQIPQLCGSLRDFIDASYPYFLSKLTAKQLWESGTDVNWIILDMKRPDEILAFISQGWRADEIILLRTDFPAQPKLDLGFPVGQIWLPLPEVSECLRLLERELGVEQ